LDKKARKRIKAALDELGQDENPLFHKNVRPRIGQLKGDYRLRIGDWRFLFTPEREKKLIYIYAILPKGSTSSQ
jgi:mRNA interferase RelE/StbE